MVERGQASPPPLTRREIREAERAAAERAAAREATAAGPTHTPAHRSSAVRTVSGAPTATPTVHTRPEAHTPGWVPGRRTVGQAPATPNIVVPSLEPSGATPRPAATQPAAAQPARPQTAPAGPATTRPAPATPVAPPPTSSTSPRALPTDVLVAAAHEMPRVSLEVIPANARVVHVVRTVSDAPTWRSAVPAARPDEVAHAAEVQRAEPVHPAEPVQAVHVRTGDAVGAARAAGSTALAHPTPSADRAAPTAALSTVAPESDERAATSRPVAPSSVASSSVTSSSVTSSPVSSSPGTSATAAKHPATTRVTAQEPSRLHVVRLRPSGRHGRTAARFGVVGALAAVTVAVPLSHGSFGGADVLSGLPSDQTSLPSTVSALTAQPSVGSPPASLAASGEVVLDERAMGNVSRAANRQTLPGCDPSARAAGLNGQLATDDLCTLWDGHTQLRADAASALAGLNAVYAARFGADMCVVSGYRTLAVQYQLKREKGGLAATPGKSNHGWGLAVDLCSDLTTGDRWEWLNENAGIYGFENPAWAQAGGSGPYERWHWEYLKGVMADGEYYGNG